MESNDLSYRLIQALAHTPRLLRPPQDMDIRRAEIVMLGCIWHITQFGEQATTPSQLGKVLQISRPAVTAQLNRLEKMGYIQRAADPRDKRRVQVQCTEKGRKILHDGYAHIQQVSRILMEALGKEKVEELIDLLQQASRALDRQAEMNGCACWPPSQGQKGDSI